MHVHQVCAEAVIVSAIIKLPFRILLNDCRFEKKRNWSQQTRCFTGNSMHSLRVPTQKRMKAVNC